MAKKRSKDETVDVIVEKMYQLATQPIPDQTIIRLHKHVFIHALTYKSQDFPDGIFRVYFEVGVQSFQIGPDHDDLLAAKFIARMFIKALTKLIPSS